MRECTSQRHTVPRHCRYPHRWHISTGIGTHRTAPPHLPHYQCRWSQRCRWRRASSGAAAGMSPRLQVQPLLQGVDCPLPPSPEQAQWRGVGAPEGMPPRAPVQPLLAHQHHRHHPDGCGLPACCAPGGAVTLRKCTLTTLRAAAYVAWAGYKSCNTSHAAVRLTCAPATSASSCASSSSPLPLSSL